MMEAIPHIMRLVRARMREATALPSVAQYRTLGHLKRKPGVSITDVARHLGVTKATASVVVEKLVQRGLLTRVAKAGQRRTAALTITPKGDRLLRQARARTRERLAVGLVGLSAVERGTIVSGLELLSETLDLAEEKAAARAKAKR